MKKVSIIRTIYLYLFTLVGLILVIIGGTRFVDMALKAFIFTEAEREERIYRKEPPSPALLVDNVRNIREKDEITSTEKEAIERWLVRYEEWEKNYADFDYTKARRHRDASVSLSLILIGLPVYLYHWRIIRRESKEKIKNLTEPE